MDEEDGDVEITSIYSGDGSDPFTIDLTLEVRNDLSSEAVDQITSDFAEFSPSRKKIKTESNTTSTPTCSKRLFESGDESASDEDDLQFYNSNKHCPVFKSSAPFLSTKIACELMLNPNHEMVCTAMPMACKTNATFLLDTDCLANAEDVKADDNGKFRHNGKKVEFVELSEGQVRQIKEKPDTLERGQYKLSRTYWVHSSNSDFKRRLTELEDHSGDKSPVVILQYQFSGDPTDITVEPHKNAKKIPKPFYVTAKSTRDKISQKAQTALGPSSIYDELYEDGGGILDKTASCTVPRSVSQVKYERGKLRKQHSKDELAELIEKCKQSQGSFVHSLQVSPDIRVVLATKSQLEDLVKFCCDPESFSIFGVDVTYNIGHFYVTTTTYNHLMLVTRETGTSPTFPGPMMMHTKESYEDFHYFGSTLKEQNHEVENILFIGSDRQKSIENGLSAQFQIAHFLACTKHVQDNIARKMAALNITGQAKSDILADIFGDRKSKQRGLIDCDSDEEFDAKVFSLKKNWDKAEKNCSRCDQPKFFAYFLVHISSDMKSKMLLPIRRAAGLGDKFYFNNSTESINGNLKKEIEKQKLRANPGDPSKCSYTEFIEIAQQFVDKYQRNVHRAVKGDGPYRLASEFQHLEIDEDTWRVLSPAEKIAKIALVDKAGANKLRETQTTTIDENQSLESLSQAQKSAGLPSFECSGLPPLFRASWKNADTILKKNGVMKVAGAVSTYVVISLSNLPNHT